MERDCYYNGYDDDRLNHRSLMVALWGSMSSTLRIWWAIQQLKSEIMQERKELAELPDYLLRDIGIDRASACVEGRRAADDLPLQRVGDLVNRC